MIFTRYIFLQVITNITYNYQMLFIIQIYLSFKEFFNSLTTVIIGDKYEYMSVVKGLNN